MKKKLGVLCLLASVVLIPALVVLAAGRSTAYTNTVVATGASTNTYVIRGEIDSVYVDFTAGCTGTVSVTDAYGTIFTNSAIAADTQYFPSRERQTTAGAGGTTTNYTRYVAAGEVSVVVVGEVAAGVTNSYTVTVIYDQH